MIISESTGYVGIGNLEPPKRLTVEGDISSSGNLWVSKSIFINDGNNVDGWTDATIVSENDHLFINK